MNENIHNWYVVLNLKSVWDCRDLIDVLKPALSIGSGYTIRELFSDLGDTSRYTRLRGYEGESPANSLGLVGIQLIGSTYNNEWTKACKKASGAFLSNAGMGNDDTPKVCLVYRGHTSFEGFFNYLLKQSSLVLGGSIMLIDDDSHDEVVAKLNDSFTLVEEGLGKYIEEV